MRYRFDAKSGHIFDGDHAVAYSHVTEWGKELVEALNAHATLTEQLAEAQAKVESEVRAERARIAADLKIIKGEPNTDSGALQAFIEELEAENG